MTGLPASRQAWITCFCTLGTSSGGISTPRSPRATISASERSMISPRRWIAAGFSSLTKSPAALPISLRPSATSSGRCTKDSATQSAPCCSANDRSARSLSVIAEIPRTTPGTLTPLWSDRVPPTIISVSAKSGPHVTTRSRTLPSSSSRSVPGCSASNTSGWGRGARFWSPGCLSRSRRKCPPAAISTRPPAKLPSRSLGPCRSARMPIGRPVSASTWRISANRARCSSCVPWLKLRRKTSTPASNSARRRSPPALAGPIVATILALRSRRSGRLRPRLRSVCPLSGEHEDGSEIIDIGQGRAGYDEVAEGGEKPVRIVLGNGLFDGDAPRRRAGEGVWVDNRPGIVFGSVDPVGITGERGDALGAAGIFGQRGGERQQEFAVAPAAAISLDRNGGLAARQQHRRRRDDVIADAELAGAQLHRDRGMHRRDVARLALDAVAQHNRRDVARQGCLRRGGQCLLRAGDQLVACIGESRIARFRRLVGCGREMRDYRFRLVDAVFSEDGACVGES